MVVKIGLIGIGSIGKFHLRHCLQLPGVELVAVADVSRATLKYAQNHGAPKVYKSFKEMLSKEDLDAVVISLPHFLHCPVATFCAEAGKDILLEKPLARTIHEGRKIVKAAKQNKVKLMVNYHLRFNKTMNYFKEVIDDGRIGSTATMSAEWVGGGPFEHTMKPIPDWYFDVKKVGGGALIDWGGHLIDLSTYFFGKKPSVLYSCIRSRLSLPFEDEAILILEFSTGTKVIIHVGWFSEIARENVTLWGTVRAISHEDYIGKTDYSQAFRNIIRKLRGRQVMPLFEFGLSHLKALEHFVNCISAGKEPSITGDDALEDLKIIYKAYEISKRF